MSTGAKKRLAASAEAFRDHPMVKLLGMRLLSVTPKRVVAELPVSPAHLNRGGRVAGGIIMTLADVLGARGTVANLPPQHRTTTLESKTNFFAGGMGPVLKATATPLHIGRTTMVWQTIVRNADGRLVAVVTQTQIVLPAAPAQRPDAAAAGSARATGRPRASGNGSGVPRATPVRSRKRAAIPAAVGRNNGTAMRRSRS